MFIFLTEEQFEELYKHAVQEPHNALVIDTHPSTINENRIKKNDDVVVVLVIVRFHSFVATLSRSASSTKIQTIFFLSRRSINKSLKIELFQKFPRENFTFSCKCCTPPKLQHYLTQ